MKYLLTVVAALSLAGVANAQTPGPEDLAAIGNNLGPTVNALASGLGNTAEVLLTTQSAVQTSAALGATVISTTGAAVAGAPNIGTFGLLPALTNPSIQAQLKPLLTAIDDPSAASIQAALNPDDLTTVLTNLQTTPDVLIDGNGTAGGLRQAGIDGLQGNLTEGLLFGLLPLGGAYFEGAQGVALGVQELVAGTNFEPTGQLFAIGALVSAVGAEPVLSQLNGPAGQLADAGAPLTDPIVDILQTGF